jgi:hypothetical protein
MKYFEHDSAWLDTPEMKQFIDEFGFEVFGLLMVLLEKICRVSESQPDILEVIRQLRKAPGRG